MRKAIVGACLLAVTGCGVFQGQGPDAPDPAVIASGDVGALCALIPIQAPAELPKARTALACSQALLGGPINLADVTACAVEAGVPPKYTAIVAIVVSRIEARVGSTGELIPPDSKAAEALRAFFEVCAVGLG